MSTLAVIDHFTARRMSLVNMRSVEGKNVAGQNARCGRRNAQIARNPVRAGLLDAGQEQQRSI